MRQALAVIMVTALSLSAAPAFAKLAMKTASMQAQADMPFTPQFEASVTRYRNCVLRQVDAQALTTVDQMASGAISACAIARGEVERQLATDIAAQNPRHTQDIALTQAESGMAFIDPLIEQAAAERAHMAFARVMF